MTTRRALLTGLMLLAALPMTALAESAPAHIQTALGRARLAGAGNFRWFGLKIYDAKLWVGDKGYVATAPAASSYALDLRYARNLVGARIAESSEDEIRKLNIGTAQQHVAWRAKMVAIFPDVQDGTHVTGIYLPHQGVRFYRDGLLLGDILDHDFALAFFAIWLDPSTSAKPLRQALLTDAAPRP